MGSGERVRRRAASAAATLLCTALLLGTAGWAAGQCIAGTPRLLLTAARSVFAGTDCAHDPVVQCLSDVSLTVTSDCKLTPDTDNLPAGAATVRLQRLVLANGAIKRNAMDAAFPYIGGDAYVGCTDALRNLSATPPSGLSARAALAALFNAVDGGAVWTVDGGRGYVNATRTVGGATCSFAYALLYGPLDATLPPLVEGFTDADLISGAVVVPDGAYAALVSSGIGVTGRYTLALCAAGTYSSRGAEPKTIATGCDPVTAGWATNKVGAGLASDAVPCPAGTYAEAGAAMCLPCDADMFAPFEAMSVCAECIDGRAPIQGSPRCFAGFGGRVLVTEGQSVGAGGAAGRRIYDPNGAVVKIYGDDASSVVAGARFPAGFPAGTAYVADVNRDDGVHLLGTPAQGWSVFLFAPPPAEPRALDLPFLASCTTTELAAVVAVPEDVGSATVSMLGSMACGRLNNRTEDMLAVPPVLAAAPAGVQTLVLTWAAPDLLVTFGLDAADAPTKATAIVAAGGASGVTLTLVEQSSNLFDAVAATYVRGVTVVANTFAGFASVDEPNCPPGTMYVQSADNSGNTFIRECRPCPDGSYCFKERPSAPSKPTACPAGTRGTVFGATSQASCVVCGAGFYQATPGSMQCAECGTARAGATTCNTFCPDGSEGNPSEPNGCTPCAPGKWRSGDMPACTPCPVGSEVLRFMGAGSTDDTAIDARRATGGQACRPCEPGFFNDRNTTGVCVPCERGTYSPRGGAAACQQCAPGTFNPTRGAAACRKAARGTFINIAGAVSNIELCPPGMFGDVAGAVSLGTGCKKCRPGTFSNATGSTACYRCDIGSFQERSAQTKCLPCPAGSLSATVGSPSCMVCPAGTFSSKASSVCTRCPAGTYQDRNKQSGCKACPPGTFCAQVGTATPVPCPAGTFNPRPNGSMQRVACLPCTVPGSPAGAFSCSGA